MVVGDKSTDTDNLCINAAPCTVVLIANFDLCECTADVLNESTKTGVIDAACIHAKQDFDAKGEAIEYLAGELPPEQLQEVAEILSPGEIDVSVLVEVGVESNE